jgi:hypothetical protein
MPLASPSVPAAARRRLVARLGATAALACTTSVLPAQAARDARTGEAQLAERAWRLDLGSGAIGGSGITSAGALTIAPAGMLTVGSLLRLDGDASVALADADLLRGRAALRASTIPSLFGVLRPVIALRGAQDRVASFGPSARVDGDLAMHVGSDRLGAWVGTGVATSRHVGTVRSLRTNAAGVHLARGPLRLRAMYDGSSWDADGSSMASAGVLRQRLHDVSAEASLVHARFSVGAFSGQRVGGQSIGNRTWGGGWAQLPLLAGLALTARHEVTPSDPSRHLPSQRLTSLGVRLLGGLPFRSGARESAALRPVARLTLVPLDTARRVIRLHAPFAQEVEIAGSFSDWTPLALAPVRDGWWEAVVLLPPGLHQINWRTDGGSWRVPPGLETMRDDYDGTVGVLVIPSR